MPQKNKDGLMIVVLFLLLSTPFLYTRISTALQDAKPQWFQEGPAQQGVFYSLDKVTDDFSLEDYDPQQFDGSLEPAMSREKERVVGSLANKDSWQELLDGPERTF